MTTSPRDRKEVGAEASSSQAREEVLHEGDFTRVVRVFPADQGPTLIRKESVGAEALESLRHERSILRRLVGVDGVPQLIGREQQADWILTVDPQARPMTDCVRMGSLDNGELVRLALALTRIVAAVHRRGVVHRDINPSNVLLTVESCSPFLIDFHVSSLLSDSRLATSRSTEIVGTLAYLAPEQTGRTGRRVDQRSDLYALGATLYEMATGRPPFGHGDPLRLVHDHVARVPTAPADLDRRLPRAFSDVVMRLLEKDPDARYQSAEGLAHDLVVVREDLAAGTGAPRRLGTRDFPQRLPAPSTMVDRQAEAEALAAQFDDALRGRARAVLIAGGPGVGKGALVEQLRPKVTSNGGWMVGGRYDQYRQDTRSDGGWQALRSLGRLLLTESEEDLAARRTHIADALGPNAGLIAAGIPEFGLLLDVTPEQPESEDLVLVERRVQQAILDLIRSVVSTGRPLVLVLDDLQWAGPTALGIIDGLLTDEGMRGLLVVGVYRDADVGPEHPLTAMLSRWQSLRPAPMLIRLDNLKPEDLTVFLQQMLRLPAAEAAELAQAVGARSRGNPYETIELVNALRRDGALVQHDQGWSWDVQTLRRYVGHGDVLELLSARLDALPRQSVALLEVMSCLRATVELILLADACGESVSRVEELLEPPVADGLVVMQNGLEPAARFRQDRVRDAVSGKLSVLRRNTLQKAIARRLAPLPQFASVAAEQYLGALDGLDDDAIRRSAEDPAEARQVVDLFRRAAHDVRSVNPAAAERYLSSAVRLLRAVRTEADKALLLTLRTEQHGVLNLLGRHHDMDRIFSAIQQEDPDPLQLVDSVRVQVSSLCDRGRESDGLQLGLGELRRLGLDAPHMPVSPPDEEQWRELYAWAADLDLAADLRRAPLTDEHVLAIAKVIEGLTAAAFFTDPTAVAWLVFESQRLWVAEGPNGALAATLGLAPAVFAGLRHDYRTGYPILRHVMAVSEARGYELAIPFLRGCKPLFASHWVEPLENSIAEGRQAREGLMKAGDFQSACYTFAATLGALLDTAPTIDALDEETEPAIALASSTANSHAVAGFISYRQLLRAMRGQTDGPGSFTDDSFDEDTHLSGAGAHPVDASIYRINRSLSAAVFDDLPTLTEQAAATMPLIAALGGYREALAHLFQALALAQQMRANPAQARDDRLAELNACHDWLSDRTHDAPTNFLHLLRFVEAERAWSLDDHDAAVCAFDAALVESEGRARPWHRALIAERAARYHLDHGLEFLGNTLITEAWRRYEAWGANAKVAQLERAYPFLHIPRTGGRERSQDTPSGGRVTSDALDLVGLIQASQALSSERNLDRLRERVVDILSEMTGATSVQVLLWDNERGDWVKRAGLGRGESVTVGEAATKGMLPLSAFRYAERTREPLLVDDATRDHRFAGDPYFNGLERCSLLVVPVLTHSEPRAMLVLENNLSRGAFSTDRLDAVNLIVGQLSVSLDNALVYSSLERKVSERTKELEIANGRLEVLAVTDELTGLANRRRLIDVLEIELLRSLRSGSYTGVMMIDIDYFKPYNDRYGHLAGDDCLRRVAEALRRSVRATDVIARYGGEEFAVVLPRTDLAESKEVAERARSAVATMREPHLGSPLGIVTVSIGIASQKATRQTTVEQVLAAADSQLYEAKGRGRNQVHGLPT